MCLLSYVCSCCRRLVHINSRAVQCVATSKEFDLEHNLMTWQLAFLRLSDIHCISQPADLSLCLGSLCSLNSAVFKQFSSSRQDRSLQPRPWLQSFPYCCSLGAGAEVPSLLRGQPEGKSSGVSSFFFNRDGPWQIILVVLRQLFGVVRTLYGEKCSSCSTVNSGTLTGTLYVIQVEKPYLCHEGCSPSFLT